MRPRLPSDAWLLTIDAMARRADGALMCRTAEATSAMPKTLERPRPAARPSRYRPTMRFDRPGCAGCEGRLGRIAKLGREERGPGARGARSTDGRDSRSEVPP